MRPASGNPVPEFGREVSTAEELAGHLLDMGQWDLAMTVFALAINVKGAEHGPDWQQEQ